MTYAGAGEADGLVTRTGGIPLAPAGTGWPTCSTCEGPMQFLAQVVLEQQGRTMAIFMCQNDPGMCDEWSPTGGGNRALLFPATGLEPIPLPALGEDDEEDVLQLGAVHIAAFEASPAADYASAYTEWGGREGNDPAHVLGQFGGQPAWLQGDETPACPGCGQLMGLVAQLEEGPDYATAMNFGGCGSAYAFACTPCDQAVFLWQC